MSTDTSHPPDAEHLLGQYEKDDSPIYSDNHPSLKGDSSRRKWQQILPWTLVGILTLLSGFLLIREFSRDGLAGFETELPSARKLIQYEKRQMKSPHDHLYVGTPSQEVDDAWIRLITGLNFDLDSSEIGKFADDTFQWPEDGKYFTGIQVNHQLHCLNRLRQFLYLPYYNNTAFAKEHAESYTIGHAEHCINYLRNSIQCHADLTPMNWHEKSITHDHDQNQHGGNGGNESASVDGGHGHGHGHTLSEKATSALALDMETYYTCRKWEPIHEWVSERQVDYFKRKDLVQGGGSIQVLD